MSSRGERRRLTMLVCTLLFALACAPASTAHPDGANASASSSAKAPPPPPGDAWVATTQELFRIGADGSVTAVERVEDLRALSIAPNGSPYYASPTNLYRVEGTRAVMIGPTPGTNFHHFSVRSDKAIWAVDPTSVSFYDGTRWTQSGWETNPATGVSIADATVDGAGEIWLAVTGRGLYRFDHKTWSKLPLSPSAEPMRVEPFAKEGVWTAGRAGVDKVTKTSVEPMYRHERRDNVVAFDLGDDGRWAYLDADYRSKDGLVARVTWGSGKRTIREWQLPAEMWPVLALGVDWSDRVWLATARTLTVVGADGEPHAIELDPVHSEPLYAVSVVKGGPTRLPATLARAGAPPPAPEPPIDPAAVPFASTLKALQPAFRACHTDPSQSGTFDVTVKIDAKGRVASATTTGGEGLPKTVIDCIVGAIKTTTFDPPAAGSATVVIPVKLVPQKTR